MSKKGFLLLALLLFSCTSWALSTFERYFHDTYQGLEGMRNSQSGLVVDSTRSDLTILNDNTSPSNIGLDLLVQIEALLVPSLHQAARINIHKILLTLNSLSYHHGSGLFFNRYSSNGRRVMERYVSSVDNMHLAFALWVISKSHPEMTERKMALKTFQRLNFQPLYNKARGLFAGGMYLKDGKWTLESWHYDYFGSEGRTLYSIGHAIGLFQDQNFPQKTLRSLKTEMNGPMLRMWDGGAFQLLLPRLLVNEEKYSPKIKKAFLAYAQFVLSEKQRKGLPVPASHSACQTSTTDYNGKAGSPQLVATANTDVNEPEMLSRWDQVFTPHAAFLAAPLMPKAFEESMLQAENLGQDKKLYVEGLGWLDGYHLKGSNKGKVVPVFLSLDQAMIALSLAQILSHDHMTVGNRLLWQDGLLRFKILKFYRNFEQSL